LATVSPAVSLPESRLTDKVEKKYGFAKKNKLSHFFQIAYTVTVKG
jgi:hypothetical protein